jgi:hypothetical protein
LIAPTANITRNQIDGIPGDMVVGKGEPWSLQVTTTGPPIESLMLERHTTTSDSATASVASVNEAIEIAPRRGTEDEYQFKERRLSHSFRYRMAAGDLRTPWHNVIVAERPRITATKIIVTPPDYAKLQPKTLQRMPNRLTVIVGSTVQIEVTGAGDIEQGMLNINDQSARTMWSDDGKTFRVTLTAQDEMLVSPQLIEPNGLINLRSPKCQIITRPDLPPTVRIKTPRPEQKVRPNDTVKLTFQARDDVGLAKARLIVESDGDKVETLDVIELPVPTKNGQPIKQWNGKTELDLSKYP